MTEYQRQKITWLEWESQRTGRSVEELREELRQRARLGGLAGRGRPKTEEHKRKLREAYQKNVKSK